MPPLAATDQVTFDQVRLTERGPSVSMSLATGQRLAVVGPGASGKSRLLRAIGGQDKLHSGQIHLRDKPYWLEPGSLSGRQKPNGFLKKTQENSSSHATEILVATRLWDVRNENISDLSPSQEAAVEVLCLLASEATVRLWDGQLDDLDPWTFDGVWKLIESGTATGKTDVIATHRPDIVELCDAVIVLDQNEIRFAGSVSDLRRSAGPTELIVRTQYAATVKALVAPFQVSVQPHEEGLLIRAAEGQALAARLLSEGYGDVETVILRPADVQNALRKLVP